MLIKIAKKIYRKYDQKTNEEEDDVVLDFMYSLKKDINKINYLEIGSGLCRFPLIIKDKFKDFSLKCLEKNINLVEFGNNNGLDVVGGDIVKMDFADREFDIIHCSHVIEHLDYKSICSSLDEMFRILKPGGYLILRSPLMYSGFYFDIDHIRPYPPESIVNYFNNEQQQRVGSFSISEIVRWYRKTAPLFYNSNNNLVKLINIFLCFSWLIIGFPQSKPNGYILILKKN
jgi:ubiquinone/menaquinone biosynthesis C-methylase UbiE